MYTDNHHKYRRKICSTPADLSVRSKYHTYKEQLSNIECISLGKAHTMQSCLGDVRRLEARGRQLYEDGRRSIVINGDNSVLHIGPSFASRLCNGKHGCKASRRKSSQRPSVELSSAIKAMGHTAHSRPEDPLNVTVTNSRCTIEN